MVSVWARSWTVAAELVAGEAGIVDECVVGVVLEKEPNNARVA